MRRVVRFGLLVVGLQLALWGNVALASGGTSVAVQQLTPQPGQKITVKGESLGANSLVEVVLTGNGRRVDLGEVQADATGDFTASLALPADLPPGTYQLTATGAKTATTQLTVVGGAASGAPAGSMAPAPVLRERPLGESIGLVVLFGALAALGLVFAQWRRRTAAPASSD